MDQITDHAATERRALARFLKAMRERVSPQEAGVAVTARRRAKGLLREEVAQAAGVSLTWYTWMEQARAANPSLRVLDGLARALRLDATEREHLIRLARPDLRPAPPPSRGLSEPLTTVLHALAPHPAYATNVRGDVIAWNAPAARLLGDFAAPNCGNLLRRLFVDPVWRRLFTNWDVIAPSAVAQFRAATVHLMGELEAFVHELERESSEFAALWRGQDVEHPPAWRKTLDHPEAGLLRFDYAVLRPHGADEHLRFTIYTPADTETEQRFARLLSRNQAGASSRASAR
jgi:transcriptional regulator with XRE-family HTH domain